MKADVRIIASQDRGQDELSDTPPNWPSDVEYLADHSIPTALLPPHLALHLCTAPKHNNDLHPRQIRARRWTRIQLITEETSFHPAFESTVEAHPALGEMGLFAERDIPPNTLIVPYLGLVHTIGEEDAGSRYDAAITGDDGTMLGIDATLSGSEARFINDYRNIAKRPNVFLQDWTARFVRPVRSNNEDQEPIPYPKTVKGIGFFSGSTPIKAGTELTTTYGKGWWANKNA